MVCPPRFVEGTIPHGTALKPMHTEGGGTRSSGTPPRRLSGSPGNGNRRHRSGSRRNRSHTAPDWTMNAMHSCGRPYSPTVGTSGRRWLRNGSRPTRAQTGNDGRGTATAARGVHTMSRSRHVTRRNALALGAAATALPLVHIRTAGAAGRLNVGFWDHWVPATNEVLTKQVQGWAEKNKVDVQIDFITSNGFKIQVTQAAEAQARTGHDV